MVLLDVTPVSQRCPGPSPESSPPHRLWELTVRANPLTPARADRLPCARRHPLAGPHSRREPRPCLLRFLPEALRQCWSRL